jgi:hypothetical protein
MSEKDVGTNRAWGSVTYWTSSEYEYPIHQQRRNGISRLSRSWPVTAHGKQCIYGYRVFRLLHRVDFEATPDINEMSLSCRDWIIVRDGGFTWWGFGTRRAGAFKSVAGHCHLHDPRTGSIAKKVKRPPPRQIPRTTSVKQAKSSKGGSINVPQIRESTGRGRLFYNLLNIRNSN